MRKFISYFTLFIIATTLNAQSSSQSLWLSVGEEFFPQDSKAAFLVSQLGNPFFKSEDFPERKKELLKIINSKGSERTYIFKKGAVDDNQMEIRMKDKKDGRTYIIKESYNYRTREIFIKNWSINLYGTSDINVIEKQLKKNPFFIVPDNFKTDSVFLTDAPDRAVVSVKNNSFSILRSNHRYDKIFKRTEQGVTFFEEREKEKYRIRPEDVMYQQHNITLIKEGSRILDKLNGNDTAMVQYGKNIVYEGPLKNGVPHGVGKWEIAKVGVKVNYNTKFSKDIYIGEFSNGKPIGEHSFRTAGAHRPKYIYEEGKLIALKKVPVSYATTQQVSYTGKVNSKGEMEDENASINFWNACSDCSVSMAFKANRPVLSAPRYTIKNGLNSYVIETALNQDLQFNGRTQITNVYYTAEVQMNNGTQVRSNQQIITYPKWTPMKAPYNKGRVIMKGDFKLINIFRGYMSGENLEITFAEMPNISIRGAIAYKDDLHWSNPVGKHVLTEQNAGEVTTRETYLTVNGEFYKGDNFYELEEVTGIILGQSKFQDPRDNKIYNTVIINRYELAEPIEWMTENLKYNIPGVAKRSDYFYDGFTAQVVCPKGWRLPNSYDIIYFFFLLETTDAEYVARNMTTGKWGNTYGGDKLKLNIKPSGMLVPNSIISSDKTKKVASRGLQAKFWLGDVYTYEGQKYTNTLQIEAKGSDDNIIDFYTAGTAIKQEDYTKEYYTCRCVRGAKLREGNEPVHLQALINKHYTLTKERKEQKNNGGWIGW